MSLLQRDDGGDSRRGAEGRTRDGALRVRAAVVCHRGRGSGVRLGERRRGLHTRGRLRIPTSGVERGSRALAALLWVDGERRGCLGRRNEAGGGNVCGVSLLRRPRYRGEGPVCDWDGHPPGDEAVALLARRETAVGLVAIERHMNPIRFDIVHGQHPADALGRAPGLRPGHERVRLAPAGPIFCPIRVRGPPLNQSQSFDVNRTSRGGEA